MPLTILSLTDKPSWTMKEPTEWSQLDKADIDLAMNKSENTWIVDFQYYSYDADHIFPKEISVINCFTNDEPCSFFAKSPNIDKEELFLDNTFQYQYRLHRTPWNYGSVQNWIHELSSTVGSIHWIYVKGAVKRDFLIKHGFQNVVDMDESGCPSLSKLYSENKSVKFTKCDLHKNAWGLCSLSNVYILRKWLISTK